MDSPRHWLLHQHLRYWTLFQTRANPLHGIPFFTSYPHNTPQGRAIPLRPAPQLRSRQQFLLLEPKDHHISRTVPHFYLMLYDNRVISYLVQYPIIKLVHAVGYENMDLLKLGRMINAYSTPLYPEYNLVIGLCSVFCRYMSFIKSSHTCTQKVQVWISRRLCWCTLCR